METILRWPGAKWKIANWIINQFPRHDALEGWTKRGITVATNNAGSSREVIYLNPACTRKTDLFQNLKEALP